MLLLEKCYCVPERAGKNSLGWHNFLHCKKLREHFIVNIYNLDIKVKNTNEKSKSI